MRMIQSQDDIVMLCYRLCIGIIIDMQIGPDDGYLHILTLNGNIYRISPSS
jgi:hypothetical protein